MTESLLLKDAEELLADLEKADHAAEMPHTIRMAKILVRVVRLLLAGKST